MIEQQLADRFRAVTADEPPMGFDPDDVVTEAGRRRRRRRAVAASAVATGGVAVVAAVLFAAGTGGGAGQLQVGAPPGSDVASTIPTSPSPPGTDKRVLPPVSSPAPTFPGSDDAVRRLEPVIPRVLAERVPGLRFDKPDSGTLMVTEERRAVGGAYLAKGTKHRYVSVFVYHDSDHLDLGSDPAASGGWGDRLSDTTLPDGSHLRVYRFGDGGDAQALNAVHLRTDGVIVLVSTTAKPEPGRQGLAVSQEVLTAIATDPRLTF